MSSAASVAAPDYYLGIYDFMHEFLKEDIQFYRSLVQPNARILELGCGTGRIMEPLSAAGLATTGLDLCQTSLDIAQEKLLRAGAPRSTWELLQGDMRSFELNERFSLIVIPFNTFLFLYSEADQLACLESCRRHLLPDGLLAIDVFNPESVIAHRQQSILFHEFSRYHPGHKTVFSYFSSYVFDGSFFHWREFFEEIDAAGGCSKHFRQMKLKHTTDASLRAAFEKAGFTVLKALGWYDGRELSNTSNNLIYLARPEAVIQ